MQLDKETRRQISKEYAQTHRPMGIYQIRNKANGKVFIGHSLDLDGILNRHRFSLGFGNHTNKALQEDWKIHGEDNFSFEVLQQIKPREELLQSAEELRPYKAELEELEQIWLEELQPYGERGYHKVKQARGV